jgi:erythromycin esterase
MDTTSSLENEQTIIDWLQRHVIPIQHVEAGNGFADLQPLKTILKDIKVVGLGETTHGTREMFQLKHRLLEFLVTEMGFTVFTIEAGFAACQPINDYVLHGKGDRATVLTGQWYVVWDTEEISAMLDWMRAYNQTVPDEKKVWFYGLDVNRNEYGRQAVLDYLRQVDPDILTITETLFEALSTEEAKWPLRIDEDTQKHLKQLLPQLQNLIDHVIENRDKFVSRSSAAEFDQILWYTRLMKQWIMSNAAKLLPPEQAKTADRTFSMAENLIALADQSEPDTKFITWASNAHISLEKLWGEEPVMGSVLHEKYGRGYYSFGFEFNQGSFQMRTILPEKLLGDLKETTVPPAPIGSLPWYLSRTHLDALILDVRAPVDNPVVDHWLDTPQSTHFAGWAGAPEEYLVEIRIRKKYDGILYVNKTTATRPTTNALQTVARRDGL